MGFDNKNVSRFYSLALGKYKNFQGRTDGLISEGVTTPDVSLNSLIYSNNSSTIVVTNLTNGCEGQLVQIINLGSTLSFTGSNFQLTDSSNLAKNDNISFINHGNVWYETARNHSGNQSPVIAVLGNSAPDVTNASVLIMNYTSSQPITGLSGGYVGQVLTIVNVASSITFATGGSVFINQATAGGYILTVSGAVQLVNAGNNKWYFVREAYSGANPA